MVLAQLAGLPLIDAALDLPARGSIAEAYELGQIGLVRPAERQLHGGAGSAGVRHAAILPHCCSTALCPLTRPKLKRRDPSALNSDWVGGSAFPPTLPVCGVVREVDFS
ncbi:hypothetical protein ACFYRI_11190 [Streptomyces microflavus]|uniref:hypothetical protein n=1 Tax=Streptomyces microflavus TaxID=1919 RepID=UPI00369F78F9